MKRHPVEVALREATYHGEELSSDDIAALKLPPSAAEALAKASREAVFQHAGGAQGAANEYALSRAREIIGTLPEPLRDPGYLDPDPNAGLPSDPAALAAMVPR